MIGRDAHCSSPGHAPPYFTRAGCCYRRYRRPRRRTAQAVRDASTAATLFERLGWNLARARALEIAGDVRGAYSAYSSMGGVRDAERLRPAACDDVRPNDSALSPRQMEIAALVAEGATNRAIGQRLNISEHTVEHHLSSIFSRLGLRSRAALAARIGSPPA